MKRHHVTSGDCVPYGIREGVTLEQTFAHRIAAAHGGLSLNIAYLYGTVGPRPGSNYPVNPATGLPNNALGQFNFAMSHDPDWWFDMSGEASIWRPGGASQPNCEPPEVYRANLVELAQRWAIRTGRPDRMVLLDIVPQLLVEDITGEAYYRTDVFAYNAIRHEVARMQGCSVVPLHDHLLARMRLAADGGASFFDPSPPAPGGDHYHNHLRLPGHDAIVEVMAWPLYAHLGRIATAQPPASGGWETACGPITLGESSAGWNGYTQATRTPPLPQPASRVRVTLRAGAGEGLTIAGAVVGVAGTGPEIAGNTVALAFPGGASAAVPAAGSVQGEADLAVPAGASLVVRWYVAGSEDAGARTMVEVPGWASWYAAGDCRTATASWTPSSSKVDVVSLVEVMP